MGRAERRRAHITSRPAAAARHGSRDDIDRTPIPVLALSIAVAVVFAALCLLPQITVCPLYEVGLYMLPTMTQGWLFLFICYVSSAIGIMQGLPRKPFLLATVGSTALLLALPFQMWVASEL